MILLRVLARKLTAPLRRWIVDVVREQEAHEAYARLQDGLSILWQDRLPFEDVFVTNDLLFHDLLTAMRDPRDATDVRGGGLIPTVTVMNTAFGPVNVTEVIERRGARAH